jgi:hypothetical protein
MPEIFRVQTINGHVAISSDDDGVYIELQNGEEGVMDSIPLKFCSRFCFTSEVHMQEILKAHPLAAKANPDATP